MFAIIGHLIGTLFRAFWRILITSVIFAVLGAGAVMFVLYHYTQHVPWPLPNQMTLVAVVGVAALAAYAGGVTALMTEAVRALKEAAKIAEREAVAPIQAVGRELEGDRR
jgi:predicted lysophospholipase L1 biosynthesis ABC-type transport system permease subunit